MTHSPSPLRKEVEDTLDHVANLFYEMAIRDIKKGIIRSKVGCGIAYKYHLLSLFEKYAKDIIGEDDENWVRYNGHPEWDYKTGVDVYSKGANYLRMSQRSRLSKLLGKK